MAVAVWMSETMTARRPWSADEVARLRRLSQTHTMRQAAVELGRSYPSVKGLVQRRAILWIKQKPPVERPGRRNEKQTHTLLEAHGVTYEMLTRKERDVLLLLAIGLDQKQIAAKLGISWHSVRTLHVPALMSKLHAVNSTSCVVMALKLGVICLDDIELDEVMATTLQRQEAKEEW